MPVGMRLEGLSAVLSSVEGDFAKRKMKLSIIVQTAGIRTDADAKLACPVDTGRLRSSIKYTKQDALSCTVNTPVTYAPDVEYGHRTRSGSTVAPRPFLVPAFVFYRKMMMEQAQDLAKYGVSSWSG